MIRKTGMIAVTLVLALAMPHGAHAQPDAEDRTLERAGKIASQPARDVGISKEKIEAILQTAFEAPYKSPRRCRDLVAELTELNEALGPDFDAPPQAGDDKATQIAEAGGEMIINSLIPFRGLVREVSGAASAERRKRAAVNAGLARRGYLRGLAAERKCKLPVTRPAPQTPAK